MPRGYRCIILAAVGWLILAAGPQPSRKNQSEKQQTSAQPDSRSTPVAVTISKPIEIVQPNVNAPPCGPDQYQAKDDLCAQWKAADAASWAALWAMIGTIVAAIGTFGLYWQIKLTRQAVQDTGKATEEMREANAIARASAESQQLFATYQTEANLRTRPYNMFCINPTQSYGGFYLENVGETEADNIECNFRFLLTVNGQTVIDSTPDIKVPKSMGRGDPPAEIPFYFPITPEQWEAACQAGEAGTVDIKVTCSYDTVVGNRNTRVTDYTATTSDHAIFGDIHENAGQIEMICLHHSLKYYSGRTLRVPKPE